MQFRLFFSFLFFWKREYSRRWKTFSISAACFFFLVLFSLSLCGAEWRKSSVTLREEEPWEHGVVANRTWCSVERERERETRRERERERGGGGVEKEPCSWVRDSNKLKKKRETKENNERQNSKMHAMESFPNLLQRAGGASMKMCVWPRCKILSCSGSGRCSAEAKFLQPCDPGLKAHFSAA